MRYRVAVPLILVLTWVLVAFGQQPDLGALERTLLAELRQTNTPGAAIAIVKDDRAVLLKGFGVASLETGAPVTPDTVFYHGGLSRMFTAAAVLSLAEDGRLDVNAPIGNYVTGLHPKLARITASQLLASTGGIREAHFDGVNLDAATLASTARSWTDEVIFSEPGLVYSSSHRSFALAGLLLQQITGKSFAAAMDEKLFAPLGMKATTYQPTLAMTFPLAQGHTLRPGQGPEVHRPFADDAMGWPRNSFTTARDLARFLTALLNGGRVDGRQVLSASLVTKLLGSYSVNPGTGFGQGYGLEFPDYSGHRVADFSTTWAGFRAAGRIVPDRRFAYVLVQNSTQPLPSTEDQALQMFVPDARQESVVRPQPMTDAEVASYAGVYQNERTIRLTMRDGRLFFFLDYSGNPAGRVELPVIKIGDGQFMVEPPNAASVRFGLVKNASGRIEYLQWGGRVLRKQ